MRMLRSLGILLLAGIPLLMSVPSRAQVAIGVSVRMGPPALPVYAQPVCPAPGYIWTPGYWAYGDDGYYWVPGTWVMAPEPGLLWTPGYWGFSEGVYVWHRGYWGPHVGFYGGINYGYGFTGVGFWGGEWRGREFVYNRSVTNVNVTVIHNYYNRTVVVNNVNRVSYNGGPNGVQARISERERIAEHEHHFEPRREQMEHEHAARSDRRQWASENHGRPLVAASGRPGDFHGRDVVAAREEHERPGDRGREHTDHGPVDRPDNARVEHRDMGREDRPGNSAHRNAEPGRSNLSHTGEARPEPAHKREMHESRAPEQHRNPHADRGPAQHSGGGHDNGGHGNGKPEHGNKPDHGKP
jgi:WXXGXW repeat (2 copies)